MKPAYHVILAEDHVRFRTELKKIIHEIPDVEIVGEVGEGHELFELLEKRQPDLVILDISMPNLRAMKATQEIKSKYPDVKVIIMVMDTENEYLSHAIAAGADGILLKQDSAMEMGLAFQSLRQGKRYFPKFLEKRKFCSPIDSPVSFDRLTFLFIC